MFKTTNFKPKMNKEVELELDKEADLKKFNTGKIDQSKKELVYNWDINNNQNNEVDDHDSNNDKEGRSYISL